MIEKDVEKLLKGGFNTALLHVKAEVCLKCGERLYSMDVINKFNDVRTKLAADEVNEFHELGRSFEVA